MNIVGLMPVRNEDWILGASARIALQWVDHLMILLHACTDDSRKIAHQIADEQPSRVWIFEDPHAKWDEMKHRQGLLEIATGAMDGPRATHIALIDADEIMTANLMPAARELVARLPAHSIMRLPFFNLRGSGGLFHKNGIWKPRGTSVAFRYYPGLHWKGDRFHHREPFGPPELEPWTPIEGAGGVMHFWAADERRHRAKHALYKMTERLRWPEKPVESIERYYGWATSDSLTDPWTFDKCPDTWTAPYGELLTHIHYGREPWQEAECHRLAFEYGRDHFHGLDLLGVV